MFKDKPALYFPVKVAHPPVFDAIRVRWGLCRSRRRKCAPRSRARAIRDRRPAGLQDAWVYTDSGSITMS